MADFIALCTTPALAAEVTLQPIRRYGFDAAILFSDILMVPWALGQGLAFRGGRGAGAAAAARRGGTARRCDLARLADAVAPILETVRRSAPAWRRRGSARTTLIGFAGAPFTVACYMVEGGGSQDFAATRAPGLCRSRRCSRR